MDQATLAVINISGTDADINQSSGRVPGVSRSCAKMFMHRYTTGALDYMLDFAALDHKTGIENYLADDEVIVSATSATDPGINVAGIDIINSGKSLITWIAGGSVGNTYNVEIFIKTSFTSGGHQREPAFVFKIKVI